MIDKLSKRWMLLFLVAVFSILCFGMPGIAAGEPGDLPENDISSVIVIEDPLVQGETGEDLPEIPVFGTALWTRTFGGDGNDVGNSVQQTSDGGYIIAGTFSSTSAKMGQVYLVKTNANGVKQWAKTYGGDGNDVGYSVQQTSDGGYIIAGLFSSTSAKGNQVYLIKTNANGGKLWAKTYGGDGYDVGYSVRQTSDNGYIIAGTFSSTSAKGNQVYLIKTNANGGKLWARTYGGDGYDVGNSVQQTADDGGYIIAGSFGSTSKASQVYLIKTNANGGKLWAKTYGGDGNDYGNSVQQTSNGGYIIAGVDGSSGSSVEALLLKTNANGVKLWANTWGGSWYDYGNSVQQTLDGGYIIAGSLDTMYKDYQVYLIKTNANGKKLWGKAYGDNGFDYGYSVQQTSDGGYIIAGSYESSEKGYQVYLVKTGPDG